MIKDKKILIRWGNKERQSNIEALRLLSMLMVLNLHSFWGYEHGSGLLQVADFFRESTSICAVNAFLLISGYFGIKWKLKSFYNLIFQLFFYAFGVYLVAASLGFIKFSTSDFLMNATCLYKHWGFITNYVLLYMLSPMLNAVSEKLKSKDLLVTILILFVSEWLITRGCGFLNYGIIYLIGRLIRKTNAVDTLKINASRGYWLSTVAIFLLVFCCYLFTPVKSAELMNVIPIGYSYAAPLVILQAIFIFIVFARINFTSNFVNWCSASCLSIFLIHMHPAINKIGYYSFTESLYDLAPIVHIAVLLLFIASVFIGCILIDKVRIFISDFIYALLCKIKRLLPEQLFKLETYLPLVVKNII